MTAAVLTPVLAGVGASPAVAAPARTAAANARELHEPVTTKVEDWTDVADALGHSGTMNRDLLYRTDFPRDDLHVVSRGVRITPAFAVGSHAVFVRYSDGGTLLMADLVCTDDELQGMSDALHEHDIAQTAIHKHLLAHTPDVWWTHIHAHGHDPVALARGLRAAIDRTGTPPETPRPPEAPINLDTVGMDEAMGFPGSQYGGVHKYVLVRNETISEEDRVLPTGLGSTTALNFLPLGGGRAALCGDFAMVAGEVQDVLRTLRRNRIEIVTLHSHSLVDEPRLFFIHIWAVGDGVKLAKALSKVVPTTNVTPVRSA